MFTEESFENVVIQYLKELNYGQQRSTSTRKFKNKPY